MRVTPTGASLQLRSAATLSLSGVRGLWLECHLSLYFITGLAGPQPVHGWNYIDISLHSFANCCPVVKQCTQPRRVSHAMTTACAIVL